jgi:hypothetical protein
MKPILKIARKIKKGEWERRDKKEKKGEYDQSILHKCMETSQ